MVALTGAIVFIGVVQTIVFSVQAKRLKQTIETMDRISTEQSADVRTSLAHTARAADAMQEIAKSMDTNAASVQATVKINQDIADRQKIVTEFQSRAYLAILFEGMVEQNVSTNIRFEPRLRIVNKGSTPAANIRFAMLADVVPFPTRDDFNFPLPKEITGYARSIGPGLHCIIGAVVPKLYAPEEEKQITDGVGQRVIAWGVVLYRDVFQIERHVQFAFTFYRLSDRKWMSMDTIKNNEAD